MTIEDAQRARYIDGRCTWQAWATLAFWMRNHKVQEEKRMHTHIVTCLTVASRRPVRSIQRVLPRAPSPPPPPHARSTRVQPTRTRHGSLRG